MAEGTRRHQRHARQVATSIRLARVAWLLIAVAALLIGVALLRAGFGG